MNCKLETQKIKIRLGKVLGDGECFICQKSTFKRGATIHHLWYIFNDVIYKNYPKTAAGQLKYYRDLEKSVMDTPKRFLYLCNTDHVALERLNRYKPEKLVSLLRALLLTKTNKNHDKLKGLLQALKLTNSSEDFGIR